jgi:hypothetical protein
MYVIYYCMEPHDCHAIGTPALSRNHNNMAIARTHYAQHSSMVRRSVTAYIRLLYSVHICSFLITILRLAIAVCDTASYRGWKSEAFCLVF